MESTTLKPAGQQPQQPVRYKRACGHMNDQTMQFIEGDEKTVLQFCARCLFEKMGIQPVAQYKIVEGPSKGEKRLEKVWGD